MPQKKNKKKESDALILRDVEREMAKPRLAESARRAALDPARRTPGSEHNGHKLPAS
jgi:hypothetical protein